MSVVPSPKSQNQEAIPPGLAIVDWSENALAKPHKVSTAKSAFGIGGTTIGRVTVSSQPTWADEIKVTLYGPGF